MSKPTNRRKPPPPTPPQQPAPRDQAATRLSLAFYFALILLAGQFLAATVPPIFGGRGVPINYLLLAITGATWLGIIFGPTTMIEFFRAIRGSRTDQNRGGDDGDAP